MSYQRGVDEKGREGGKRFVARIKRAYEDITGEELGEGDYRDPRTRRVAKVRMSARYATELDELTEELGLPPRAPELGPIPELKVGPRFVVVPAVPVAPPFGPLAPRAVRGPRFRIVPRAPYLVEAGRDGEVLYFERNSKRPPRREEYRAIAAAIDPEADYVMRVRRVLQCVDKDEVACERKAPLEPGELRSAGTDEWEGRPVESRWTRLDALEGGKKKKLPRGETLTAGRLEGLGEHWRKKAPPYVYGRLVALTPVGPEGQAWVAMRDGEENCVVASVRRALKEKGRLTQKRKAILDEASERFKNGAEFEDVGWLSTKLKVYLPVYDAAGRLLYHKLGTDGNPVYADGSRKKVALFRSDGHCSGGEPRFAEAERVELYHPKKEDPREGAVELIKAKGLSRAKIVGGEVLAEDGTLWRPYEMDRAIHDWLAKEGKRAPRCDECDHKLASREDGSEFVEDDVLSVGGVEGRKWKKWIEANGFLSLWEGDSREHWRKACVEASAWESSRGVKGCLHYDMRAAYLACDEVLGCGPAKALAERFGFPAGGRQRYAAAESLKEVEGLAGAVLFQKIVLGEKAHPFVKSQIRRHLEKSMWLPIPMAVWLAENSQIREYKIDKVMYSVARTSGIRFPGERDVAVRFVGRCAFSRHTTTFFTKDEAEKNHFLRLHKGNSEAADGGYLVEYEDRGAKTNDYSPVRAYVVCYMEIAMMSACLSLKDKVRRCSVDAIFVEEGTDMSSVPFWDKGKGTLLWGMFREKPWPPVMCNARVGGELETVTGEATDGAREQLGPVPCPELSRPITAYISPAGSGKTYRAMRLWKKGDRVVVLAHNNAGVVALSSKEANPHGFPVYTYHQWLHIGAKGAEGWNPLSMGKAAFTEGLIWDEFAVAGAELLGRVLPWLRKMGIVTVLCGDPLGQLQEFADSESGEKVMDAVGRMGIPVASHEEDWRARDCPRLQRAKKAAWCRPYIEQVDALLSIAKLATPESLPSLWRPGDLVIEPTRAGGAAIGAELEKRRAEAFPSETVRYRFKPENRDEYKKARGVLPTVAAPGGGFVSAVVGLKVEAPPGLAAKDWVADTTTTVHSVQGATVKAPAKIFICIDKMWQDWCRNAVYVAMSRAERAEQLVAITSSDM